MSIDYRLHCANGRLTVTTSGEDDSLEGVAEYGLTVVKAAIDAGCTRILCDERRLKYSLGTLDTYTLAVFVSENAPSVLKVALVCSLANLESGQFWETVAVNRGVQVRVFTSLEEASAWLDSPGDPPGGG